ncbi:MAG: mannosyl-3-phosphoglycerate phosphatase [Pseudohongiella sp.]|nr:MAG: mannosyl-3-phosphoglycerate phosphatase [Pseudohongiella sp.]
MTLIVFTDLDGGLMEHETYSIEPAREALDEIANRQIQLILNSSKTAAEMTTIQELLDLHCPFICENGAALHGTAASVIEFGPRRDTWLPEVHALRGQHEYSFQGFSDWSTTDISAITGLSKPQAEQARSRIYSEPILWRDSEASLLKFQNQLRDMNLRLLQGGRFQSIQGSYDKSDALRSMVVEQRQKNSQQPLITVALGDSPNDAAMLNAADVAVIIKSAKSSLIHCPEPKKLIHTKKPGPAGWNEAILEILALYDSSKLGIS